MEAAVDLSRPGEIIVPFRHTCDVAHGIGMFLERDPEQAHGRPVNELLRDLSGEILIQDGDARVIHTIRIDDDFLEHSWGAIAESRFASFPPGEYMAKIRVRSGADALPATPQRVRAAYLLCGLERIPAGIFAAAALAAGLIALIATACVLPGVLRARREHFPEPCGTSSMDDRDRGCA